MPKQTITSPMQLIAIYMTPQLGVGQLMNIDTIRKRLAKLPLANTLEILGQVSSRTDAMESKEDRIKLANALLRPVYAKKAIEIITKETESRHFVVSTQLVTALATQALVYCNDDVDDDSDDQALAYEIGNLLLALAGTLEKKRFTRESVLMEMVRIDIWYRIHDFDRWCELAYILIFDILPTLHDDADWIDSREIIERHSGVSLEVYCAMVTTMALHGYADKVDGHKYPLRFDSSSLIDSDTNKKLTDFFAISITDARIKALEDIKDEGLWTFSTFYDKPLIKISDDIYVAVRAWFMMNKVSPIGFFNTIDLLNRQDGEGTKTYLKWSRLYGKATELLGRKLIQDYIPKTRHVSENEMNDLWGEGKKCDSVLIDDDWIALDFVYRRVSKPTSTTGDITDLAKDLEAGVFEKIEQIDATLGRALAVETVPKGDIFTLVVVGAPFPVNGILLNEVDKWVLGGKRSVLGINKKCVEPLIMDLEEFWALLETAKHNSLPPSQLLRLWSNSALKVSNFRNWLATSELEPAPLTDNRRYHNHAIKYLFGH